MLSKFLILSNTGTVQIRRAIVATALENISLLLPFILIMQIMMALIDPLISGRAFDPVRLWLMWGVGLAAFVLYFFLNRRAYDLTYTSAYSESLTIRTALAEHMRKLPFSFFNRKNLSELTANMMEDCSSIEQVITHIVPLLIACAFSSSLACLLLAFYDWRMALAMFAALPLALAISWLGRQMSDDAALKHISAKLTVSDVTQQFIEGIKIVKAFNLADKQFVHVRNALRDMMATAIRFEMLCGIFCSVASIVLQAGIGLVILTGAKLMADDSLAPIPFFVFVMVTVRIYGSLLTILSLLPELNYMLLSTARMRELLSESEMSGDENTILNSFDIRFENVSFAYNDDDVIHNVSLNMKQNTVTALVGLSGSGKSTLIRLIARFWDPSCGCIYVGGKKISDIDPNRLMHYMSFVFQDVVLFNDTVLNNIRIGAPEAPMEQVCLAASKARCDEFINRLPQGYNTVLGENGCRLSGGERQRISIARALLKNAPIVLLDEATASLDAENEEYIQQAISELVRGKTVIVIAHRLRTVTTADTIVVMEKGKIVEQGTFDELINNHGLFHHLYSRQHIWPLLEVKVLSSWSKSNRMQTYIRHQA
jgi:ATP-binding cassette subfamily B protein